jgi:type II restriction enzyme
MSNKYNELLGLIDTWVSEEVRDFKRMSKDVGSSLNSANADEFLEIVKQIGIIPEKYDHDSTQEKLYAKMSDCVIATIFEKLGYQTAVLTERADAADVSGKSVFHGYDFVADAKVFRLSRTAKNQKDFKITMMSHWKKDADYAMLIAPFYQYPNTSSQIYKQVLDTGVALNSFEHLLFLLSNNIKETKDISLQSLFQYPKNVAKKVLSADAKKAKNVFDGLDKATCMYSGLKLNDLNNFKALFMDSFVSLRANHEKEFWLNEMEEIQKLSLEEARIALIENKKIRGKISSIEAFIVKPNGMKR